MGKIDNSGHSIDFNVPSPKKDYYISSLTLSQVFSIRDILSQKIQSDIKIKEIYKIIKVYWFMTNKTTHFVGALQAIDFFASFENSMQTNYSEEEKRAGIETLSSGAGAISTSIGKMFSIDPDIILNSWQYMKILGILYQSYEESEYRRRLQKVYDDKMKGQQQLMNYKKRR